MFDILGSIDEKIENLESINNKLQALCLAEYKRFFSNTERIELSNIATVVMGQSPDGTSLNTEFGTVFYQGRTDFGFRFPTVRLYTTQPKRIAKQNDVLLSVRAPVGDVNIAKENCCIGRGIAAISSRYCSFIYYSLLTQKEEFDIYNNSGTIFGSINKDALLSFKIPAANINLVIRFNEYARIIDKDIYTNSRKIEKLKELKEDYLQKFFRT